MTEELRGHLEHIEISKINSSNRERQDYGDLEELADSIKAKGVIQPIVVDSQYNLIAGGRRLEASKLAKQLTIPAMVNPGLGEIDKKELELIENLDRKDFTWQEHTRLVKKIHLLYKSKDKSWSGRDTAKRLGKSKSVIADQLKLASRMEEIPELSECKNSNDAWKTVNKLEEIILLQELERRRIEKTNGSDNQDALALALKARDMMEDHKEEHGEILPPPIEVPISGYQIVDCFDRLAGMDDESLGIGSIIECDPPYGIDLGDIKKGGETDDYNEINQKSYPAFLEKLCQEFYRTMGDQSTLIFWFAFQYHHEVCEALRDAGFIFSPIPAIWYKLNSTGQSMQPKHLLASNYEPFILARKGTSVPLGKAGSNNVFMHGVVTPKNKIHPTERPVGLIKEIIQQTTIYTPSTRCFVPFLGSGNTLTACEQLGINAFGCDLSEVYQMRYEARKAGVEI